MSGRHAQRVLRLANAESRTGTNYSRINPVVPLEARLASTVLIVESDARTADTLRNMLQEDGYTVLIVSNAQQALEILRTTVPAAFIAEVEGSDMSGQDLCLIIKRNERLQRVPVILLTRAAQPADYSGSHQMARWSAWPSHLNRTASGTLCAWLRRLPR